MDLGSHGHEQTDMHAVSNDVVLQRNRWLVRLHYRLYMMIHMHTTTAMMSCCVSALNYTGTSNAANVATDFQLLFLKVCIDYFVLSIMGYLQQMWIGPAVDGLEIVISLCE